MKENTIKTTVVVESDDAKKKIVQLNDAASDSSKDLNKTLIKNLQIRSRQRGVSKKELASIKKKIVELKKKTAEYKKEEALNKKITQQKKEEIKVDEVLIKKEKAATKSKAQLNEEKRLANRIEKLNLKLNTSAVGSYDRLSAQYSLNKIKLNAMSSEMRKNTQAGKELETQTKKIYEEMSLLQEATGKHTLSVGDYSKAMRGLDIATSQVVRELPALAINSSTFFLAISNNIPMLFDQLQKLKEQNAEMAKEGKKGVNVLKAFGKSLLSLNSIMMIGVTLLTFFGDDLVKFIGNLFKSKEVVDLNKESLKELNKALLSHSKSAAEEIAQTDLLYEASINMNNSMEDRIKAAKELIKMHPTQWKNITAEKIAANKAADAYERLRDSIMEAAKAEAYKDRIKANYSEIAELESNIEDLNKQREKENALIKEKTEAIENLNLATQISPSTSLSTGLVGLAKWEGVDELGSALNALEEVDNKIKDSEKKIKFLEKKNESFAKKIKVKDLISEDTKDKDKDKALDTEDDLIESRINLMKEGRKREIKEAEETSRQKIKELKKSLKEEKHLTKVQKEQIAETIKNVEQKTLIDIAAINKDYDDKEKELKKADVENLIKIDELKIEQIKRTGESTLLLEKDIIDKKRQLELEEVDLTESEKALIKAKYRDKELQAEADERQRKEEIRTQKADAEAAEIQRKVTEGETNLRLKQKELDADQELITSKIELTGFQTNLLKMQHAQEIELKRLHNEELYQQQIEFLEKQRTADLANTELTESERAEIEAKYGTKIAEITKKSEEAKTASKLAAKNSAIGFAAEAFGISKELAVADMIMKAPQAIGNSFEQASKVYPAPLSLAMGALGAAGVVIPIYRGLKQIKETRFSKSKGGGGHATANRSLSNSISAGASSSVNNIAANNAARLGIDPNISKNASSMAANNMAGVSSEVVFSENKYNDFKRQVEFKEDKTSI